MTGPQNFSAMGDLLKKVMENPELLSGAMNMASALASSGALNGLFQKKEENPANPAQNSNPPPEDRGETAQSGTPAGMSGLSGLAGLLGALGGPGNTGPQDRTPNPPGQDGTPDGRSGTDQPDRSDRNAPAGQPAPHRAGHKERIALLEAMRPFISPEKKDRLELLIRLLGVMEIAEDMGFGK